MHPTAALLTHDVVLVHTLPLVCLHRISFFRWISNIEQLQVEGVRLVNEVEIVEGDLEVSSVYLSAAYDLLHTSRILGRR